MHEDSGSQNKTTSENHLPTKPESLNQMPVSSIVQPAESIVDTNRHAKLKVYLPILGLVLLLILGAVLNRTGLKPYSLQSGNKSSSTSIVAHLSQSSGQNLSHETVRNYGNKYANGLLPVGDSKYNTKTPTKGYIYACQAPTSQLGGAGSRGPWFTNNNTQWDSNKKLAVQGTIHWTQNLSINISGDKRIITTNALPNHVTGVYPIGVGDPVHPYDANPSTIAAQSLTYSLDANPTVQASNSCIGGEVGVMTTGAPLFSAFDAGGRDAGAWEAQDSCDGHPQQSGEYHYHTLSRCITTQSYQTVIGYALDGFAITGPKVDTNNIITTSDLDECHGMTGPINLDGKTVTSYHYVMTQDFPYSVSCFKGIATQPPRPNSSSPPPGTNQPPPRRN